VVGLALLFGIIGTTSNSVLSSFKKSDYGLVPGGYIHKQCIHKIESHERALKQSDGSFIVTSTETNNKRVIGACDKPRFSSKSDPGHLPANGWQVFTYFNGTSDLSTLNGTWNVPDVPQTINSQTVFLFTSLVNQAWDPTNSPNIQEDIIQPVLQFGSSEAGGGPYWTLASWYVGSNALYSDLIEVQAGNTIFGAIIEDPEKKGSWNIISQNVGVRSVNLVVDNLLTEEEPWATVTLEVYSVDTCEELPTQSVDFEDIVLQISEESASIDWISSSTQVVCTEAVSIDGQDVSVNF